METVGCKNRSDRAVPTGFQQDNTGTFESLAAAVGAPFAGLSRPLDVASRSSLEAKEARTLVEVHKRAVQPGGPE
jgi:hypothetical protein